MKLAINIMTGLFVAVLLAAPGVHGAPSQVTLTVADAEYDLAGTGFSVNVEVDDPQYVLGAAFTVQYDTTCLTLTSVESNFFDTFENQFDEADAYNDPPTSVTVDQVTYLSPLVAGPKSADIGGTRIAGVRVRSAGTDNTTLCTLHFEVNNAAYGDTFSVTLAASTISNETAGYDGAGEQVPMLITQTGETSFEEIEVADILPGAVNVVDTSETSISGTLTVDGQAVANTVVVVYSPLTGTTVNATTDENGHFEVTVSDSAAGAALRISFTSPEYGQYTMDFNAADGAVDAAFANSAPDQPVLVAVTGPVGLTPTLETEPFSDANNGHGETQWQIVDRDRLAAKGWTTEDLLDETGAITDETFLIYEIQDDLSLTALTVPDYFLNPDSAYAVRTRFFDDCAANVLTSPWSDFRAFDTEASPEGHTLIDGVLVPDGQMLSEDELALFDADVVGIHTTDDSVNLGVAQPDNAAMGRLSAISVDDLGDDALAVMPDNLEMPYGLVGFNLELPEDAAGSTVMVSIYFSEAVPENMTWWKFYKDDQSWIDFSEHAEFAADRKSVELTLVDGGDGDADGLENCRIVDPGGVGMTADSSTDGSGGGGCFIHTLLE